MLQLENDQLLLGYASNQPRLRWWQVRLSRPFMGFLVLLIPTGLTYLALLVSPSCGCGSNLDVSKSLVSAGGTLATQIDLYAARLGHLPHSLQDLCQLPDDPAEGSRYGAEPYIMDPKSLKDAWGQDLQFLAPGVHNPQSYDLWSAGPDMKTGTEDDIGNW